MHRWKIEKKLRIFPYKKKDDFNSNRRYKREWSGNSWTEIIRSSWGNHKNGRRMKNEVNTA
jgi:hypothetical protein